MTEQEREEELEVLRSIYEGDDCFKELNSNAFQFRVGKKGDSKSFIVELTWPNTYPNSVPDVSLDAFFNVHLSKETKEHISEVVTEQATTMLGTPMTYSLLEFLREEAEELVKVVDKPTAVREEVPQSKHKGKKEVLSKQAKRKLAGRTNAKGEMPRGWNWVDIVQHLSKSGSKGDDKQS